MYYVWQCHGKSEPWISIFKIGFNANLDPSYDDRDKCIFVGTPDMLLKKYAPEQIETEEFLCDDFCDEHGCPFPDDIDPDLCGSGCCKNTN